jgi:hypothetical protein
MLRRISTKFGKSKKDQVNGINGTNETTTTNGAETNGSYTNGAQTNGASSERAGLTKRGSSFGFASKKAKPQSQDHSASRADVEHAFAQFAQIIHASRRPLPTQNGGGGDLDPKEPSGLMADIKSLGFKDVGTLMDVMKNKATGDLQDDKTYIMEHTIQVSCIFNAIGF